MKNQNIVPAAFNFCKMAARMTPFYGRAPQIMRAAIALFLCAVLVSPPVFAADSILSQNFVAPSAEVALTAAQAQSAAVPEAGLSNADEFESAGALSAATVSAGRSLYVSNSGSDKASGFQGSAFKSLAYAVSQLRAGDTLYIEAGTYQQPAGGAVFTTSGTSDAPITIKGLGNVVIQGTTTTTISGYTVAANYNPAFDTKGQDYINFENLTVNNLRAAVTVSPNSSYITVDGLKSDRNHFAVLINGGDHVTVRNAVVTNSRNGFRTEATTGVTPTDILYENIDVSGSADVYSGFEPRYRNGDGFILEYGNRITLRNVVSHDNWDAGFDVKAINVLMERVTAYGNKNNFKVWGSGIVVKDSLSYGAKIRKDDPVAGEGFGVNARMGSIKFINTTFVDNENADIRADNDGGASNVTLENSIIARKSGSGSLHVIDGGSITAKNSIWYNASKSENFALGSASIWADPKFADWNNKNYRLQAGSPAINLGSTAYAVTTLDYDQKNRVVGGGIDVGAYEYQGASSPDTTAPVISGVNSFNSTSTGTTIGWKTNEAGNSQVEYRLMGAPAWTPGSVNTVMTANHSAVISGLIPDSNYEARVKSTDQAGNLAVQTTALTFRTLKIGATPLPPVTLDCTTSAICGIVSGQTVSGTIEVEPNLTLNPDIRKAAYYLNGILSNRQYSAPFTWGGSGGFDTTKLADGVYTLTGAYTTQAGDQAFTINFSVKNAGILPSTPPSTACTSAICGITAGQAVSGNIKVQPNLSLNPNVEKVFYYLDGILVSKEYSAPFAINGGAGLDTFKLTNGTHTLAGSYATNAGDISFSITFTVNNVAVPATACNGAICLTSSVSGQIMLQPNLAQYPGIRKVFYYLHGDMVSKEYSAPFKINAGAGLNVSQMGDGTYTIDGTYAANAGDQNFAVTFTVKNGAVQSQSQSPSAAVCTTAMCGVSNNQTVSGTLLVQPNLAQNSEIRKVSYYWNGILVNRVYSAPFTLGGSAGFDTRNLVNGTHILTGAYTTDEGDVPFKMTFTIDN